MINVRAPSYDQLSARSWWPASEKEWLMARPYIFWDIAYVGLTTGDCLGFPKLSVAKLQHHLFPLGITEVGFSFPSFFALPALIRSFARTGGPPSSADPVSTCLPGTTPANYSYQSGRDEEARRQESSALRALAGDAMMSSIQGYH